MEFFRKYGTGTGADIYIPIIKRGVVDYAVSADWTPASGDVKISIDGGTAANIGTLPTAVAMGNTAYWKFVFADAELQGKKIIVTVADSATKAVEDQALAIITFGHASAYFVADLSLANLPANVTQFGGTNGTFNGGRPEVNTTHAAGTAWGSGAITAASVASDAVTEIQTAITGGAYALSTDANGRIRIVDGTGAGEINTNSGAIALVDLVTDITTKTGFRLSATGVDDIWDEPMAAHTTADTPGSVLNMLTQDTVTLSTDVALGSIIGQLLDAGTSWSYDRTTDSLEALRERGDAAWITNTDASIRSAVGLTSANLDAQLDALPTANEVRNAVTGGAYALNTDSNGSIRIVDGTGTGELDTLSGTVLLRSATEAAIAAILDDTGTSGVVLTSAERNSVADALLDRTSGVESGVTPRQAFRGMSAILAGIISGAGTGTEVFKGIGQASGGTTRVTVTVDSSGNRSAMSLNL